MAALLAGSPVHACAADVQERVPVLSAHGDVGDEVGGAVDERQEVDKVPEEGVDFPEEAIHEDAEEDKDGLRQLRDYVQRDDSEEHDCCAPRLGVGVAGRVLAFQPPRPLVGHLERVQKETAKEGDQRAGYDLSHHRVDEEVHGVQDVAVVLSEGRDLKVPVGFPCLIVVARHDLRGQAVGDNEKHRPEEGGDNDDDGGAAFERLGPARSGAHEEVAHHGHDDP